MTSKMPIEWEEDFVEALKRIQASKQVYWVQAKWIAIALFGYNISGKEFRKNKMRVYRLGSLIKYYHTDNNLPFFEKMRKWAKENKVKRWSI